MITTLWAIAIATTSQGRNSYTPMHQMHLCRYECQGLRGRRNSVINQAHIRYPQIYATNKDQIWIPCSNWYSIHSAYKGSHTFNHSVACCKVQLEIVCPVRWHSSYLTSFRCAGMCVGECVQVYVCGCVCMCMGPLLIAANAATLLTAAVALLIAATLRNIM